MKWLLDIFRRNLLKKIIALIAAFIMWIFVMDDQDPPIEGSYNVPLTISNTPQDFATVCNVRTVRVETRAPRSNFVKYDANAFRVYANLDGLGEGPHQIIPKVVMPQGFELVETDPAVINVNIDSLVEYPMAIDLVTQGEVAPNSAIKEIRKSMDFVTVVGPKSLVERVAKVYGSLSLAGTSSSFETQISMNAVDAENNLVERVRVVPSVITVSVEMQSGLKKRIVPVVPELSAAEGWELTKIAAEPAQLEIVGAESVVNNIFTLKTVPFTVQTGQRTFTGTLKLDIPDGVQVKTDQVTVSALVVRKPVMRDSSGN